MKNNKKVWGLLGIVVSAVVTTVMTDWMNERTLRDLVDEKFAELESKKNETEEES
jgi:hypothetical protein